MIQATGTLTLDNGLQVQNPLINIFLSSSSKFEPTLGIAQIGTVETQDLSYTNEFEELVVNITSTFKPIINLKVYQYTELNPSFEAVQTHVLDFLTVDYPDVNFEIV